LNIAESDAEYAVLDWRLGRGAHGDDEMRNIMGYLFLICRGENLDNDKSKAAILFVI
jgi:hypothetical protein